MARLSNLEMRTAGIYQIQKQGQRIWILTHINTKPMFSPEFCTCECGKCGTAFGWFGGVASMPPCPTCHPESVIPIQKGVTKKRNYNTGTRVLDLKDGIYSDISQRGSLVVYGYSVIRGGKIIESFSRAKTEFNSKRHEEEAVKYLIEIGIPKEKIFCDEKATCERLKINLVNRSKNPAHKIAYHRKGFHGDIKELSAKIKECCV